MCFGNNNPPQQVYLPHPPQPVQMASVRLTDQDRKETDPQTRERFAKIQAASEMADADKNVLGTPTDKLGKA
jgi:hypothetical protein